MAYKYSLSEKALDDLNSITEYISVTLCNPSAAAAFLGKMQNSIENVCLFPESCPLVANDLVKDRSVRKLFVDNYIVFYKFEKEIVFIVRILYGMQNYKDIL